MELVRLLAALGLACVASLLLADVVHLGGAEDQEMLGSKRDSLLEMLEYGKNPTDKNPFENFGSDFPKYKWHESLADKNVFKDATKGDSPKPYGQSKPEENVLDEMPDKYPFNEIKNGHTWHEWTGDSVMQSLGEHNVLDDLDSPDRSFQLGEHSLGRPFRKYKAPANVLDTLDTTVHKWSAYRPDKNVFDGLSPDSGYDRG
mmetsp:Transcript_47970/g.116815  ORF Transcript_47970/g.116815 Transcript_47970/m.116815 type:complete len:202 (-) Transcript_47970:221-826(-)